MFNFNRLGILLLFLSFQLFIQGASCSNLANLKCRVENYYLNGNVDDWADLLDSIDRLDGNREFEEFVALSKYALIGNFLGTHKRKKAREMIHRLESDLDKMLKENDSDCFALSLKAACYGFRMGLNPLTSPIYGPGNHRSLIKASESPQKHYIYFIEKGNSAYFTPAILGGNKEEAFRFYEMARDWLADEHKKECNWLYFNQWAWLGRIYADAKDYQNAHRIFIEILKEKPNFKWVKEDLLPALEKRSFESLEMFD